MNSGFCLPGGTYNKLKVRKMRDKYQDIPRELKKKTMQHEGDIHTNCKGLIKRLENIELKGQVKTTSTTT